MTATVKPSSFRINVEKQESLVKLGILVLAAILCELLEDLTKWAFFFFILVIFSFLDSPVLGASLRKRHP